MESSNWYNEEFERLRQWSELINHPYFSLITDKIKLDINNLQREIDKLVSTPSLDNSIHATALAKSKENLVSLLRHFTFMMDKKLQLDKEVAKRKEKSSVI